MKHLRFRKALMGLWLASIGVLAYPLASGAAYAAENEPVIVVNYIPKIGTGGIAEGQVVWNGLTAGNAGDYAVIAMLHVGGDDYVKPTWSNYLNAVDPLGYFSIDITTNVSDHEVNDVYFYFVRRETFNGINGNTVKSWTMADKQLGQPLMVNRTTFWANRLQEPRPNILPGFVDAGQNITLTANAGETIRYTRDGSDPKTSPTAVTYTTSVSLKTPSSGSLLIKAVSQKSGAYSSVASLLWMPKITVCRPFWGLNVSLALNGEPLDYPLSEEKTRERMNPLKNLTYWIRTFGTLNKDAHINKIAKELGLNTLIGVYITPDASQNEAQIQGLRQILEVGPVPDLIAVGNEPSIIGVSQATLISCIDAVRELVKSKSLVIPIGTVDIANPPVPLSQTLLERLNFFGTNIYDGTHNRIGENQMFTETKRSYDAEIAKYQPKLVLLTEIGTPHNGRTYSTSDGGTQTPSHSKAQNYLKNILQWIHPEENNINIPLFYFETYDEPAKGNNIEQYFGVLGNDFQPHPFYEEIIRKYTSIYTLPNKKEASIYPNPIKDFLVIDGLPDGTTVSVFNVSGVKVKEQKSSANGINVSDLPDGVYWVKAGQITHKVIKKQ